MTGEVRQRLRRLRSEVATAKEEVFWRDQTERPCAWCGVMFKKALRQARQRYCCERHRKADINERMRRHGEQAAKAVGAFLGSGRATRRGPT